MLKRIAIIFLAIIASPFGIKCQPKDRPAIVPYCLQSDLDIYALPPTNSLPVPSGHLLVFEIHHIGKSVCQIDSPVVQPFPKLSDQDEIDSLALDQNGGFRNAIFDQLQLAPGDWVHVLMAWTSLRFANWRCLEYSGVNLLVTHGSHGMTQVSPISVEVRNLQLQFCGGVFLSDYQKGHYSLDTEVLDKWLDEGPSLTELPRSIPTQTTSLKDLQSSPLYQVSSDINRILLGIYFSLDLKFSSRANNLCDFRSLRKRESNGTTVISFQNCPESINALQQPQPESLEPIQTRVDLRALGMLPLHSGPVAYDLVTNLGTPVAPSLAEAHIDLVAHDPTPPAQATIINPLPECTEFQLHFTSSPPVIAAAKKYMRVYEATNTSAVACSLAGSPRLNLDLNLRTPCPNCTNDLFGIRPNGRIDLMPRDSAHFLLGSEIHSGKWDFRRVCTPIPSITIVVAPNNRWLNLPYASCGGDTLDVSTWREGKFDNDPMNLQWAKTHLPSADPTTPIPQDCNKPELLSRGRPIMIPKGKDLAFGLSLAKHDFTVGEKITLHIWVDNTGDTPAGVMTCMGLDHFKANGFNIYDAYGHRLLRRNEAKIQEGCKTNPTHSRFWGGWSCTRNFPITIPAHSCVNGDDYDFTTLLTDSYDLPPGEYTVRSRKDEWHDPVDVCKPQDELPFHPEPGKELTFSVIQP